MCGLDYESLILFADHLKRNAAHHSLPLLELCPVSCLPVGGSSSPRSPGASAASIRAVCGPAWSRDSDGGGGNDTFWPGFGAAAVNVTGLLFDADPPSPSLSPSPLLPATLAVTAAAAASTSCSTSASVVTVELVFAPVPCTAAATVRRHRRAPQPVRTSVANEVLDRCR